MSTLYVTEPGARIEKENKRILVTKEGTVLLSIPIFKVSEIVLIGSAGLTTPAMLALLDNGIHVNLLSRSGSLRGKLISMHSSNIPLLKVQFIRSEDAGFKLTLSKAFVNGKLHNCRVMALRMRRNENLSAEFQSKMDLALGQLSQCLERAANCENIGLLRGYEGLGTRAYFSIFRLALNPVERLKFENRQRRPPRDPLNSMLSFGYSLLANSLASACEIAGLDANLGFFHTAGNCKPALALDLMEEFRPIIVDSIVLRAVNEKRLQEKDFFIGEGGKCLFTRHGLRIFLLMYSKRIQQHIVSPLNGIKYSYQRAFEEQVRQIRSILEGNKSTYQSFRVR